MTFAQARSKLHKWTKNGAQRCPVQVSNLSVFFPVGNEKLDTEHDRSTEHAHGSSRMRKRVFVVNNYGRCSTRGRRRAREERSRELSAHASAQPITELKISLDDIEVYTGGLEIDLPVVQLFVLGLVTVNDRMCFTTLYYAGGPSLEDAQEFLGRIKKLLVSLE